MTTNIFEQATKQSLRFDAVDGFLNVEDLWHMRLEKLDDLAMSYKKEIDTFKTESFLSKQNKVEDTDMILRLDVCKSVIESRVADIEKENKRKATKDKNQRIMALIVKKEDEAFEETDIDELRKMLETEEE